MNQLAGFEQRSIAKLISGDYADQSQECLEVLACKMLAEYHAAFVEEAECAQGSQALRVGR